MLVLLTDDDDRPVALYRSVEKAAEHAEREALFATAYADDEGELKEIPAFWSATMNLNTFEISSEQCAIYKHGSAERPCRHAFSALGSPIQELGSIVAWGATEKEAVERVESQKEEGIRRARRDKTWKRIEDEARENDAAIFWDPYGLWIDRIPGLRDRLKTESEAAYNAPITP